MSGSKEINRWTGAAPFWEKHRDVIHQMFAPVTGALVEDAGIGRGHTVLDIATGAGEPALSIAARVGPEGKVCGIDPVSEMVAIARRAAARSRLGNAQFEVAYADHLPFPEDTFDAVVSRFGAMFFPSPVDGVRELLRVLKPGRKLALAVWHSSETNPMFHAVSQVIERHIAPPPPEPDAMDAFRYATPGKLRDILDGAGVVAPCERLLRFTMEAPVTLEQFWTMRCETSERLREMIARLSADQVGVVKREALEALREYSTASGMRFPSEVLIVSGTRNVT